GGEVAAWARMLLRRGGWSSGAGGRIRTARASSSQRRRFPAMTVLTLSEVQRQALAGLLLAAFGACSGPNPARPIDGSPRPAPAPPGPRPAAGGGGGPPGGAPAAPAAPAAAPPGAPAEGPPASPDAGDAGGAPALGTPPDPTLPPARRCAELGLPGSVRLGTQ